MIVSLKILDRDSEFKAGCCFTTSELTPNYINDNFNCYLEEFGWDTDQSKENAVSIALETLYELQGFDDDIGLIDNDEISHKLIINNQIPLCNDTTKGVITTNEELFSFWSSVSDILFERASADIELE